MVRLYLIVWESQLVSQLWYGVPVVLRHKLVVCGIQDLSALELWHIQENGSSVSLEVTVEYPNAKSTRIMAIIWDICEIFDTYV
jgi:hypothetical protein